MKNLIFSLILTIVSASFSFAQSFDWAITSQGKLADEGNAVCMDAEGNSFVTGSFSSTPFALGGFALSNTSVNSAKSGTDMFVAKIDAAGRIVWAIQSKGTGAETGVDIACDKTGHIVVVGTFKDGDMSIGSQELSNDRRFASFIMRLDARGNIQWIQKAGGKGHAEIFSVSCAPEGEIYITGSFAYGVTFGGYEYKSKSGNNASVFVAKYLPSGDLNWFEQIYGTRPGGQNSNQMGKAIFATSDSKFVYVAGWFRGRTTFGNEEIVSNSEPSPVGQHKNIFITKYDRDGNAKWTKSIEVKQVNFSPEPEITDLAVDDQGNSYMTGYFPGALIFGNEEMKGVASKGKTWNRDIFLVKYDADGNRLWQTSAGGSENDVSQAIALTSNGVLLTGSISSLDAKFGGVSLPKAFANAFAANYDAEGKCLWVVAAKTGLPSQGNGIAAHGKIAVVTGQYLANEVSFGKISLKGEGAGNFFAAKIK